MEIGGLGRKSNGVVDFMMWVVENVYLKWKVVICE